MEILILIVLVFIAFMLWRIFNQSQSNAEEKAQTKRLEALMPHLAQTTNEELKNDLKDFALNGPNNLKEQLEFGIQNEVNPDTKLKLQAKLKQLGEETAVAKKFLENTEATDSEKLYLINAWYEGQAKYFFDLNHKINSDSFDDFFFFGGYKTALPLIKS